MTENDIAWAAGLFEGEGCFNIHHRKSGGIQVQAKLSMTDQDVVEKFYNIVGVGQLHPPREFPDEPNRKTLYTWVAYRADKVFWLAETFLPYFGERRSQKAREVLSWRGTIPVSPKLRTHCPSGHPYSGSNLGSVISDIPGKSYRYCRECRSIYKKSLRRAA